MQKSRIALVGAGYIAEYHVRALQKLDSVEVVTVVAKTMESAKKLATKYGIPETFTEIRPVLENASIDAVILSTPNSLHAPHAIRFLETGKDVFIEKPLATSEDEAMKILKATEASGKNVMVGHMWRFDQEAQYIRDAVQAGKLGSIIKTKGYGIHVNWGPSGWFTQKELAGGGALADMGVHAIDTVRFLLNDPCPTKVYARISTNFGNYDVDDSGILVITWDNGTESIIESGWWQPHADGPEASTALFGTKGYANLYPTSLKFKSADTIETVFPKFGVKQEHCDQRIYDAQMSYFVNCVQNHQIPVPGIKEGITVSKIVDAAYKSAQTGAAINL